MEDRIKEDLKQAQLQKADLKVSTLRLLLSEIHNLRIAKGDALEDKDIILVLQREIKKRKEAALGFRAGGREDQAKKEEAETSLLQEYLPAQLSNEELTNIVDAAINELATKSLADMGQVMAKVLSQVGQSAEAARVSEIVRSKLNQ